MPMDIQQAPAPASTNEPKPPSSIKEESATVLEWRAWRGRNMPTGEDTGEEGAEPAEEAE